MIRRELFAFAIALGIQQLPQQALDLGALASLAVQLRHQVQHDVLESLRIVRKMFRIEGHARVKISVLTTGLGGKRN